MIETLITACLFLTVGLGLFAPFLPLWAMWRAVIAAVLTYILSWQIQGPVHWSDQDFGYSLFLVYARYFAIAVTLAVAIRLIIAAVRNRLSKERFRGPGWVWIDCALCDLGGLVIGFWLFQQMAWRLSGAVGPGFDWTVAAFGLGAGVALTALALRRESLWPVLPAATLGALGLFRALGRVPARAHCGPGRGFGPRPAVVPRRFRRL